MGYYNEFPHTRIYDGDLGWLIKMYKELLAKYTSNNEYLNEILENLEDFTQEQLNKWLEDGTIGNIIEALGNVVSFSDTTQNMIADTSLAIGQLVYTLGYSSINDGGGSLFTIVDSVDSSHFQFKIAENKYATLIGDTVFLKQVGAIKNESVSTLINSLLTNYKKIVVDDSYIITAPIISVAKMELCGTKNGTLTAQAVDCITADLTCANIHIHDLTLVGDSTHNGILFSNTGTLAQQDLSCVVENMLIRNFDNGINIENNFRDCRFSNIRIESSNTSGMTITGTDNRFSNVIISISNKHGFLVYGYSNDFTQCKAFCCGYGGDSGVGFNSQSAQYLRVIDCEFQQNRFQNLVLNNTFNSTFVVMCDSSGWLESNNNDIKNIELNGSCYNNLTINLIDGRTFGDYSYCVQGIYAQYNNNNANNIIMTVNNVVPDRDYQIATGMCNTFIFSLKNKFIVNGAPYLDYDYRCYTVFDFVTPNLSNVQLAQKVLTYSNITSTGQYRVPIPLDTSNIGIYLDEINADSGITLTGSIIIRYNTSQYYTSQEQGISNAVGGKVYVADVASMVTSLGSVTINQIQLRLIANGTTGGGVVVKNPKILIQRSYTLANG